MLSVWSYARLVAACFMLGGLFSCTAYDSGLLGRYEAPPDAGMQRHATERAGVAAAGCGATCEAGSSGARDRGTARPEGPAQRDASVSEIGVTQAGGAGPRPNKANEMTADAGPGAQVDDADSGSRTPLDASMGAASDPSPDNGFCNACDSTAPSNPVLNDSGGTGNVTTFGSVSNPAPSEGGACNYGRTGIKYFAAINASVQAGDAQGQWQSGRICGQCASVRVKTPAGWKESVVRIVDKCTDPYCGVALSGAPAKDLMGQLPGRYQGNWRFVSCQDHPEVSDGPAAIHVKEGSSRWWALVHVRNPVQAVTSIDWQSVDGTTGTFPYSTDAENYYSVPDAVRNLDTVHLTINYRDKTQVAFDVSVTQLTTPEANINLP